jgi:hypothetical protein
VLSEKQTDAMGNEVVKFLFENAFELTWIELALLVQVLPRLRLCGYNKEFS